MAFFFQAEDGIRDYDVTGVQTCALPISIEDADGNAIGEVTSGGYGPSVGGPIAMGYVAAAFTEPGTPVNLIVRGKALAGKVAKLPFVEQRYFKS